MMEISTLIHIIILSLVESITEFLPISSTAHIILAQKFLKTQNELDSLISVFIQSGCIISVLFYFRKDFFKINHEIDWKKSPLAFAKSNTFHLRLIISATPIMLSGLILHGFIKSHLFTTTTIGLASIIGAGMLFWAINRKGNAKTQITLRDAFLIGLFQVLALIPGFSRSGACMIGGFMMGYKKEEVLKFSFLCAVIPILGAGGLDLLASWGELNLQNAQILALGSLFSFCGGIFVIHFFMLFLKKIPLNFFVIYRITLGLAVLFVK